MQCYTIREAKVDEELFLEDSMKNSIKELSYMENLTFEEN